MHRRQLPLAYQCEGFVPAPGSTGEGGFCERCCKQVHDVSAMRESELRRLLAAHVGGTVCLSYRTDARGLVQLRPEPAPPRLQTLAVGALALLLAACAGHGGELELPGAECRDADGYAVSCPEWSDPEMLSVPEAEQLAMRDVEDPSGEPTEPMPEELPPVPLESIPPPTTAPDATAPETSAPEVVEPETSAPRTTVDIEAVREIDVEMTRGVVLVVDTLHAVSYGPGRHGFVPTAELVEEARERRAERKEARHRWRAARRREAASR